MTDLQILTAVKNSGGTIRYTDLLNLGLTDAAFDPLADRARIHVLRYAGALSGDLSAYSSVSITAQGRLLLAQLQTEVSLQQEKEQKEHDAQQAAEEKERQYLSREESRKQADRKAEHAFQYKLSLLNALLTFVSGLISGAVLANLDRLVPWIISFFH